MTNKSNFGVTGQLKEGDIINVINPFLKEDYSYYKVTEIVGNKAITKFRTFNKNIYYFDTVVESGKNNTTNTYKIVKSSNGFTIR